MRKGSAIKQAIETMLRKTWVAAGTKQTLGEMVVRFAGKDAMVVSGITPTNKNLNVLMTLPDFDDNKVFGNDHADRIVAYALHEMGHCLFTKRDEWDDMLAKHHNDVNLHRCINCFEDVRMERALVTSGYAVGAKGLLTALLKHLMIGVDASVFTIVDNVPFAVACNGRQYGIDVSAMLPECYKAIVAEATLRCDALKTTTDACDAGLWLWKALCTAPKTGEQPGDEAGDEQDEDDEQGEKGKGKWKGKGKPKGDKGEKGDDEGEGDGQGEGDGEGDKDEAVAIKVGDNVLCPDGMEGVVTAVSKDGKQANVRSI